MPRTAPEQFQNLSPEQTAERLQLHAPRGATRPHACVILTLVGLGIWLAVLAIPNSARALLFSPSDIAYFIRGVLITIVALVWSISPAIGPRYGAKVNLTPLAALVAVLAIPLRDAVFPALFIGLIVINIEDEPNRRAALLGRSITILVAQALTCIVMSIYWSVFSPISNVTELPSLGAPPPIPWHGEMFFSAVFSVAYLALFRGLLNYHAKTLTDTNPGQPVETGVAWDNEMAMILLGVPIVAAFSLLFPRSQSIVTCLLLWMAVAIASSITHALIEGNMMRRQLRAVDRLTAQAAIGKSPTPDRLISDYFEQCSRLILYDRATIWLFNEQEMALHKSLEYASGSVPFSPAMLRFGEQLIGRVAERAKPMLAEDVRFDPRHHYCSLSDEAKSAIGPITVMIVPIQAGGELVGVVEFERRSIEPYRRTERERIQSLCSLVGMSLANNRLHQDVIQQAVTDGLTGLYNKRQILKTLADEGARAERYGKSLSVMMLDLDSFKKFNDTYGHMQGDVLLKSLADLIKSSIRAADVAGRYGGEEFIVVMPETGREAAWVSAERLRQRVEAEEFKATFNYESTIGLQEATEDRKPRELIVHRTISIGVATFPADAANAAEVLQRADEALYAAKNGGRNKVCLVSYPEKALPISISEVG